MHTTSGKNEGEDIPEWKKKGYTYWDAEDTTQINGCKIVGGRKSLPT